jgi:hypothetical protein
MDWTEDANPPASITVQGTLPSFPFNQHLSHISAVTRDGILFMLGDSKWVTHFCVAHSNAATYRVADTQHDGTVSSRREDESGVSMAIMATLPTDSSQVC